ncbi:MarR family winged helix-turn-helix transcriptional regulator [Schnuerera sp.]|uniref:MarR family winged helix-turn-helix transcriptional regulator n=1 Tax=Schnuerera sp. TaxID=2794844 RepID=UPI002C075577|nr:MarR family transcriptional regulator [Schnuerera sp.]HSH36754.1 MarR family transcriptional regulator [Schnuerera sp.]
MELQKISETISNYIRECSNIIHTKGHQIAQEYDLTYDQYHLLIYLSFSDKPPTINEISRKFNRAQNTISEKITRLEEKGLVSRVDDIDDRRITRVIISEEGLNLIRIIKQERSNRVTFIALEKMKKNEAEDLLNNLGKLYNNLNKEG